MVPRFKPSLNWKELTAIFRLNRGAVEKFEKEFARKFKAVDAIAFPYGRSAQWAFFKALGVENAEVIMPAYTCSVVAHAVTLSGNKPVFIDIDLHDYNMNLDLAEKSINAKTRAIIATHTFGYPQDLDRLESMVERAEKKYGHKIWLMQDCCHAFGAEWKGRMIGTSGDVAVYSFNISKILTSIFGGMLTFQDKALADKIRVWREENFKKCSLLKSLKRRFYLIAVYFAFNERIYGFVWWMQKKTTLLNKLTESYHLDDKIHFPGDYKQRMLNCEAAVGLAQLKKYDDIIKSRRDKAEWYDKHFFVEENWYKPSMIDGATYSHYTIRVTKRNEMIEVYAKQGVELGKVIQYVIPNLTSYNCDNTIYSNSNKTSKCCVNLPLCNIK